MCRLARTVLSRGIRPEFFAASGSGGTGFGGITDIKTGSDGYLYVLSIVDGNIYTEYVQSLFHSNTTIITIVILMMKLAEI
jgi:hypothetical protein